MPVQIGAKPSTALGPTGMMSDCHRRIEMFMKALSAISGFEGRALNEDERRALNAALTYFREAAPKHNADEEESLFPRLRSLPDVDLRHALADIDRLEQEHRWAGPLHEEIDRLGRRWLIRGGLNKEEADTFQSSIEKLSVMYRSHIELEDSTLFPLARRVLSPGQSTEIAAEMAKRRM
jgi:hemerythrin-like domain-containing protein